MTNTISKINIKGITYNIGGSLETVEWSPTSNMNDFVTTGEYEIFGERKQSYQDNIPVINGGNFHANLKVYSNENASYISQIINFDNFSGGDTNTYIRNKQNGVWSDWAKQQGNVEVNAIGVGQTKTFDDLTDNGVYSGVNVYQVATGDNGYPIISYETFVLIVINAYLTGGGVSQLKYSTLVDDPHVVKLQKRLGHHTDNGITWANWEHIVESELNDVMDNLKYVKKFQNSFQTAASVSLYRYNYYRFKNSSTTIGISLLDKNDGFEDTLVDTYEFEFHVNSNLSKPIVLYNRSIKWANNTPPPYTPGKIYQISIQNNLGVWAEFNQ